MSNSVRPHRQQPTRLPRPWDSPGKKTGESCHFLLQCGKVKSESEVTQSCPTLSNPMDCSLPGSPIHGIFQARVLEWGAIAFSTGVYLHILCFLLVHFTPFTTSVSLWKFTLTKPTGQGLVTVPGGLVARIQHSHHRGPTSVSGWELNPAAGQGPVRPQRCEHWEWRLGLGAGGVPASQA